MAFGFIYIYMLANLSQAPAQAQPLGQAKVLVSLSQAPAQAQPLGQAKVAIIGQLKPSPSPGSAFRAG
jgi:hypothetical protein